MLRKLSKINYKYISVLMLGLISFPLILLKVQGESPPNQVSSIQFLQKKDEPPPDLGDKGAPVGRGQGGPRSPNNCPHIQPPLTAIVPSILEPSLLSLVWGTTIKSSPSLWFYLPYSPRDVESSKLIIWDGVADRRKHPPVYQGNVTLEATPGIIRLSLADKIKLKDNQKYHWYLSVSLKCNPQDDIGVNAWVWIDTEKLNSLTPTLAGKSKEDQAFILAQEGIWQDAFTLAVENSPADWQKLLMDIDLHDIVTERVVDCCSLVDSGQ